MMATKMYGSSNRAHRTSAPQIQVPQARGLRRLEKGRRPPTRMIDSCSFECRPSSLMKTIKYTYTPNHGYRPSIGDSVDKDRSADADSDLQFKFR